MSVSNSLVNRVRKLLALAGNNPDIHEAEAAMAKAQQLILQHNISEELLKAETKDNSYDDVCTVFIFRSGRVATWLAGIAATLAEVNGCVCFISPKEGIMAVGEMKDIGLVEMLLEYLNGEVVRLCKQACRERGMSKSQGRIFANRFKMGASSALRNRLTAIHKQTREEATANLDIGSSAYALTVTALARIDNKLDRAREATPKLQKTQVHHRLCPDGYKAGVRAGNNIRLQPAGNALRG